MPRGSDMLDWGNIAPMVVMVVATLTTGGVIILRPLSKRVSDLLEVYARDKGAGVERELRQTRELVETLDARLRLMEERQDFTEKLMAAGDRPPEMLPAGNPRNDPAA